MQPFCFCAGTQREVQTLIRIVFWPCRNCFRRTCRNPGGATGQIERPLVSTLSSGVVSWPCHFSFRRLCTKLKVTAYSRRIHLFGYFAAGLLALWNEYARASRHGSISAHASCDSRRGTRTLYTHWWLWSQDGTASLLRDIETASPLVRPFAAPLDADIAGRARFLGFRWTAFNHDRQYDYHTIPCRRYRGDCLREFKPCTRDYKPISDF